MESEALVPEIGPVHTDGSQFPIHEQTLDFLRKACWIVPDQSLVNSSVWGVSTGEGEISLVRSYGWRFSYHAHFVLHKGNGRGYLQSASKKSENWERIMGFFLKCCGFLGFEAKK